MLWKLREQGRGPGEARLVDTNGDWVIVEATLAFPIGATLIGTEAETGAEYRIKVRGGKKLSEGCFRVEGRLLGLTREGRERLLAALSAAR